MSAVIELQLIYLLRILGAIVCGAIIGYERESHMKMAGIRTHAIVSMTAALMMILSKYGFNDVLSFYSLSSTRNCPPGKHPWKKLQYR